MRLPTTFALAALLFAAPALAQSPPGTGAAVSRGGLVASPDKAITTDGGHKLREVASSPLGQDPRKTAPGIAPNGGQKLPG